MSNPQTSRNLWMQELEGTFALAWPLVFAQLAQMALFTTDVVMMSWLGPTYLAAGTLATAFLHPLMLFGIGVISAVAPMVAQALGARDYRSVRRTTRQGFWVSLLISAGLLVIYWNARTILIALGQTTEMADLAERFVQYAMWAIPFALLFTTLRCMVAAHGGTRAILIITLVAFLLNAGLGYGLIFGHWGLPRMELGGAGLATTLTNLFMFLALLFHVLTHRRLKRYHILARFFKSDWPRFRELLRIGIPFGLMLAAEVGLFACAVMLMGWLGTNEVAAHAVALQCSAIAFMVPLGLSQATTVRVGLAYGQHDPAGVHRAGWVSIGLGVGFMVFTCSLFVFVPGSLIGLFLNPTLSENAIPFGLAVTYLGISALFQLFDGAQVVAGAALRGLSDSTMPMVIAIFGYWCVGLPIAYICGFVLEMRGLGIWIGLACGLAMVAVILCTRFAMREKLGLLNPDRLLAHSQPLH